MDTSVHGNTSRRKCTRWHGNMLACALRRTCIQPRQQTSVELLVPRSSLGAGQGWRTWYQFRSASGMMHLLEDDRVGQEAAKRVHVRASGVVKRA